MDDAVDAERSPEVLCVKNKIHETGVDMFFDIHGDEALPYNFVAGNEMLADFTPERLAAQNAFIERYMAASPDFQNVYGYAASKYNEDLLTLASKYIGHTFKCLSLTLEMPFKDNANLPDAYIGWNGARSAALGAAILQPILCGTWKHSPERRRIHLGTASINHATPLFCPNATFLWHRSVAWCVGETEEAPNFPRVSAGVGASFGCRWWDSNPHALSDKAF